MQLNNKITGCIAIIDKWDLSNCKVKLYENGMLAKKKAVGKDLAYKINLDLNIPVDNASGTVENELLNLIYMQLLTYPELQGFEVSNDVANWAFPLRTIRVSIERKLALHALHEDNALGQLFNLMRVPLKNFILSNENTLTLYLEELFLEHRTILEQYPEKILIENKV